jgi:DNA-directed RNA polymerase subunit K/omega
MLEVKNWVVDDSNLESKRKGREAEESTAPVTIEVKAGSGKVSDVPTEFGSITSVTIPLTKYEKSRIIGARALQLSLGAPALVQFPPGVVDPLTIAETELKMDVLPITIHRKLPRNKYENIPLSKLARDW